MRDLLLVTTDGRGTVCLVVRPGKGSPCVVSLTPSEAQSFHERFAAALENAECELDPDAGQTHDDDGRELVAGAALGFRGELDTPELDDDDARRARGRPVPVTACLRCGHRDFVTHVTADGKHTCPSCGEVPWERAPSLPGLAPEPERPPGSKPDKRPRKRKQPATFHFEKPEGVGDGE